MNSPKSITANSTLKSLIVSIFEDLPELRLVLVLLVVPGVFPIPDERRVTLLHSPSSLLSPSLVSSVLLAYYTI